MTAAATISKRRILAAVAAGKSGGVVLNSARGAIYRLRSFSTITTTTTMLPMRRKGGGGGGGGRKDQLQNWTISRGYSVESAAATAGAGIEVPDHLDDKERAVFEKLVKELLPSQLNVRDVSGGCGSMYAIEVQSPRFKGLPVVRQHRLVNTILKEEIKGWHGVQLTTKVG